MNLDENLAVTLGGSFFGGILIGYALKKIIKIVAIITGFFLAALAYLQYQQIANINWDGLQTISEDTITKFAKHCTQKMRIIVGMMDLKTVKPIILSMKKEIMDVMNTILIMNRDTIQAV